MPDDRSPSVELLTPEAWIQRLGLGGVLDADGWRTPDAPAWSTSIGRDEFDRCYAQCTVGPRPVAAKMPLAAVLAHWRPAHTGVGWAEANGLLWRNETDRMNHLRVEIDRYGIREPIVLGADQRVWDGHHRLAVACDLSHADVPVAFSVMSIHVDDGCQLCQLPATVHALWCPHRPVNNPGVDEAMARVHEVFADPSRAWFATQFWTAYEMTGKR